MTQSDRIPDDTWARLDETLEAALAHAPSRREAFVTQLALVDPLMAKEVGQLVRHADGGREWFNEASKWLRPGPSPKEPSIPEPDPLVGASVRQYRVERRLGEGAMGIVYLATDILLDRQVALKFPRPSHSGNPDGLRRLIQEARSSASLDHPNICTVFEVGEWDDGRVFIAMAFHGGGTLKQALSSAGRLPTARVVEIARQVARALAFAHSAGVVHRDVKPSNVMIAHDGTVKLVDFGVALSASGSHGESALPAGTLAYAAPEQLRGEPVDERADLWALGVILWEMLEGERPFAGDTAIELVDAIEGDPPKPRSGGSAVVRSPCLRSLAERLLSKEVGDRPATAQAVADALDDFAVGE